MIESGWYQAFWGNVFQITSDQNTKSWIENDRRGMRRATSTGSGIYGAGADIIVSDDPQDPEKGESEVERETVIRHYGQTLYSRLNDQRLGLRLVIQQRLHQMDLTGHLVKNNPEMYEHLCIPAELTDDVKPKSLRKMYKDGLFFPERFSWDVLGVSRLPTNMGEYGYSGQILQRPSPPGGGTFKDIWWRFWQPKGSDLQPPIYRDKDGANIPAALVTLPDTFEAVIDSWDTAMDGQITRDDVVGQKWAKIGASKYLLGERIGKFSYPETKVQLKALRDENPLTSSIVVERSANGPAIKADLQEEVPGIITIPTGRKSKEDRVKMSDTVPYQAQAEAGNVYLPHPQIAPWVNGFIEEHGNFPKSVQDGQVDAASQAVNFLTTKKYVWPCFQPALPEYVSKFETPKDNVAHYGALCMADGYVVHVLTAVWRKNIRKLYVYGELVGPGMSASKIAAAIVSGMKYGQMPVTGLYGNQDMFSPGRSAADVINAEIAAICQASRSPCRATIQKPPMYDLMGAVGRANLMFYNKEIVVHQSAIEAARQFSSWHIDDGKPAKGYPFCEALCIIVNEIARVYKIQKTKPPVDGYRKRVIQDKRPKMNSFQVA